jgi:hypothetical protein
MPNKLSDKLSRVLSKVEYRDLLDFRSRRLFEHWHDGFTVNISTLEFYAIERGHRRRLKHFLCPDCAHEFGARKMKACPQCGCKECDEFDPKASISDVAI